jgi:hypothetical protein
LKNSTECEKVLKWKEVNVCLPSYKLESRLGFAVHTKQKATFAKTKSKNVELWPMAKFKLKDFKSVLGIKHFY